MSRRSRTTTASAIAFAVLSLVFTVVRAWPHATTQPQPTLQPTVLSAISTTVSPTAIPTLAPRTKTADCVINGVLADAACTPGAAFSDVTVQQICTSGYSASVRDVPAAEKNQVYAEYGIATHTTGQYEVDHLISLELGGSNDVANLWPEAAEPRPGFHEKDVVENYLHDQVCKGAIPLAQAQQEIATGWLAVYQGLGK